MTTATAKSWVKYSVVGLSPSLDLGITSYAALYLSAALGTRCTTECK